MIRLMAAVRTTLIGAAWLLGVPTVLIVVAGSPIPSALPSATRVEAWLADPLDPAYGAATVEVLAWTVWVLFAIAILSVIVVRLRTARWAKIVSYLPPPAQSLAAALLGTAVVATSTSPVLMSATAASAATSNLEHPELPTTAPPAPASFPPGPNVMPATASGDRAASADAASRNIGHGSEAIISWARQAPTGNGAVRGAGNVAIATTAAAPVTATTPVTATATTLDASPQPATVPGHARPAVAPAHTVLPPAASVLPAGATTPESPAANIAVVSRPGTPHPRVATEPRPRVYQVVQDDWMSNVAERFLGDQRRYVDIERLNPGFERRDARFPDHWEPGWKIVLPADAHDRGKRSHATGYLVATSDPQTSIRGTPSPATPTAPTTSPQTTPSPTTPRTSPTPSAATITPVDPDGVVTPPTGTAAPSTSPRPTASPDPAPPSPAAGRTDPRGDDGVTLPGGWVGLPLAAALVAAGAMVWRRRQHRYRPLPIDNTHVDENDLRPLPPPVTQLRQGVRGSDPGLLKPPPPQPTVAQYARGDTDWQPSPTGPGGPELAGITEPVPPGGLALTGPGAEPAARALLVATLSTGSPDDPDAKAEVVIPTGTLTALLGAHTADLASLPRLHITRNLPDALSHLLQLVVNRQRTLQEHDADDLDSMRASSPYHPPMPPIVLVADAPSDEHHTELTNTLHLAAALQIRAVLLGDWAHGQTRTVQPDGHTDTGERFSVLDAPTAAQFLQMLREAHTGEPTTTAPAGEALDLTRAGTSPSRSATEMPAAQPGRTTDTTSPGQTREPATLPASAGTPETPDAVPPAETPTSGHVTAATPRTPAGPRVRVRLFGGVTILDRDGAPVRSLRQHARQLLVYLAVHRNGADLPQIMEVIWPDATLRRAGERLQTEVGDLRGRIRHAAGDDKAVQPVINTGGHYVLNADLLDVDVWQFTDALQRATTATDTPARIAALRAAVNAHTGALSQGYEYDWIEQPGEHLRRHGIRARLHLADLLAGTDPHEAADLTQAAAALDPYNEDVARQAMRALALTGDAAGVRAQLQRLRTALPEIDEEPSEETIALAAHLQREIGHRPTGEAPTDDAPEDPPD